MDEMSRYKVTLELDISEYYGNPAEWNWPALLDLRHYESIGVSVEPLPDE